MDMAFRSLVRLKEIAKAMHDHERDAIEARALELGLIALIVQSEGFSPLAFGDIVRPVVIHSMRKSILSALYGEAIGRGAIDPRHTLAELAIDDDPKLTEAEKSATVFDLLAARSGVYLPAPGHDPTPGRPARGSHAPGTFWNYNNWDFNVLGNIYERLTMKNVFIAFDHVLAKPLGMQDWDPFRDSFLEHKIDPIGGNLRYPNHRMALSARDLLKFGQLYLKRGKWNGAEIVNSRWIDQSTRAISRTHQTGATSAYGLLWWVAADDNGVVPAGTFTAFGFGGNYLTIIPVCETVVVSLVDTRSPSFKAVSAEAYNELLRVIVDALERTLPARALGFE
jgi:CubicO group peptidase (beta-lactamase class C family)